VVPFLVVSILDFREIPTKAINASPIPACASTHSLQELAAGKDLLHPDAALPENQRGYACDKKLKILVTLCICRQNRKSRTRSRSESQLAGIVDDAPPEDLKVKSLSKVMCAEFIFKLFCSPSPTQKWTQLALSRSQFLT
jgi:hypothetical protein